MGNVSKKGKNKLKELLLEVFLLGGVLTKLCLYKSLDSHTKPTIKIE